MNCSYCDAWFFGKATAQGVLTEQQAKRRHALGKRYTVLVSPVVSPIIVEVDLCRVGVFYLDRGFREIEQFEFERDESEGPLFLRSVLVRVLASEEPSRDNVAIRDIHALYDRNGEMTIAETDYESGVVEVTEVAVDLALNWKHYPEFGRYEHLLIGKARFEE